MFVQKDAFPGQDTEVRPVSPGNPDPGPVQDQAAREIRLDSRETVQTPTAVVFLTQDRAYKLRKAVNLGFVDFRARRARLIACEDEVRLNRRLAPDVYLGVADIRDESGALCDHMVVMRRLPAERRLAELVTGAGDLTDELRALARRIALFHERCETTPEITKAGGLCALEALWLEAMDGLAPFRGRILDAGTVDEIGRLALRYLTGRGPLLAQRQSTGRIRDGHGDLLADDIYCLPDGPRVLDCVSVDPALRVGDVLGDAASLAADLERLGAPAAARTFLDAYREFAGETHPASLEHLYIAYRAVVGAGRACVRSHQGDPAAADEARRLADIALGNLRRGRVRLILVGGLPGTGKSTLARNLVAAEDGWVLLRPDLVRKELAGLAPTVPVEAEPGAEFYGADATEHSYAELLARARHALERGQTVVLDASWSSQRVRALAAEVAGECDADLVPLRCVAPPRVAIARIALRAAASAAVRTVSSGEGPVSFAKSPVVAAITASAAGASAAGASASSSLFSSAGGGAFSSASAATAEAAAPPTSALTTPTVEAAVPPARTAEATGPTATTAAARGDSANAANTSAADEWIYLDMATRTDPWPGARDVDTSTPVETTVRAIRHLTD